LGLWDLVGDIFRDRLWDLTFWLKWGLRIVREERELTWELLNIGMSDVVLV
jgi:hypothetical protein